MMGRLHLSFERMKKDYIILTGWKCMTNVPWQSPKPEADRSHCWQCRQWWRWHPAFGSRWHSACIPGTWENPHQINFGRWSKRMLERTTTERCRLIVPIEQPRLLCAGQCSAEFFRFTSNGGVLKFRPSKLPLFSAPCCDGIAVCSGTEVGVYSGNG